MNNKPLLYGLIAVAVVLIAGGLVYASKSDNKQVASESQSGSEQTAMENTAMMEKDKMSADDKMMSDDKMAGEAMTANEPSYKDYSVATAEAEFRAGNKVVLFFHAPWCPYCKEADAAFKANTSSLPKGVTVLKTDYDSSNDLKKKYGISYQHTFVQIDANGNQIAKWTGGDVANVNKYVK